MFSVPICPEEPEHKYKLLPAFEAGTGRTITATVSLSVHPNQPVVNITLTVSLVVVLFVNEMDVLLEVVFAMPDEGVQL